MGVANHRGINSVVNPALRLGWIQTDLVAKTYQLLSLSLLWIYPFSIIPASCLSTARLTIPTFWAISFAVIPESSEMAFRIADEEGLRNTIRFPSYHHTLGDDSFMKSMLYRSSSSTFFLKYLRKGAI